MKEEEVLLRNKSGVSQAPPSVTKRTASGVMSEPLLDADLIPASTWWLNLFQVMHCIGTKNTVCTDIHTGKTLGHMKTFKMSWRGAAHRLRAQTALAEDPGSILNTPMMVDNHL